MPSYWALCPAHGGKGGFFFFLIGLESRGHVKRWSESCEGHPPGLAVAFIQPHGGAPGIAPAQDWHQDCTWLLSIRASWRPGCCGSYFSSPASLSPGLADARALQAGRVPLRRPSHLFHPAIKPGVKYLLNNAISPAAHYGVYLAINYGL